MLPSAVEMLAVKPAEHKVEEKKPQEVKGENKEEKKQAKEEK